MQIPVDLKRGLPHQTTFRQTRRVGARKYIILVLWPPPLQAHSTPLHSVRLHVPQFTIFEQTVKRVGLGLTSPLPALDAALQ